MAETISSKQMAQTKAELVAGLRKLAYEIEAQPNSSVSHWETNFSLAEWVGEGHSTHRCRTGDEYWTFSVYLPENDDMQLRHVLINGDAGTQRTGPGETKVAAPGEFKSAI